MSEAIRPWQHRWTASTGGESVTDPPVGKDVHMREKKLLWWRNEAMADAWMFGQQRESESEPLTPAV